MSVIRSERNISKIEYENSLANLYHFSRRHTSAIPKRRKKWLGYPIDSAMNRLYFETMAITEYYSNDADVRYAHKAMSADLCIQQLLQLEKPLMVMWNVQKYETRRMASWVELVNRVIFLFSNLCESEVGDMRVSILDWKTINEMNFLKGMSELHRYVHGKVVHERMNYDSTIGALMTRTVDDAFYYVMKANMRIPTTKSEYENRRNLISQAISLLQSLNRTMVSYFNLMECSERVMREWSEMLIQELTLLRGVQASDKKRFGKLK